MAMYIDPDMCTACDDCRPICPTKAIKKGKVFYTIDAAASYSDHPVLPPDHFHCIG